MDYGRTPPTANACCRGRGAVGYNFRPSLEVGPCGQLLFRQRGVEEAMHREGGHQVRVPEDPDGGGLIDPPQHRRVVAGPLHEIGPPSRRGDCGHTFCQVGRGSFGRVVVHLDEGSLLFDAGRTIAIRARAIPTRA